MSKLFAQNKPKPQPEEPVAPVPDDELSKASETRRMQRRYGGRGRSGTVLSGGTQLG